MNRDDDLREILKRRQDVRDRSRPPRDDSRSRDYSRVYSRDYSRPLRDDVRSRDCSRVYGRDYSRPHDDSRRREDREDRFYEEFKRRDFKEIAKKLEEEKRRNKFLDEENRNLKRANKELREKWHEDARIQELLNADEDEDFEFVSGNFSKDAEDDVERANIAKHEADLKKLEGKIINEIRYRRDKINDIKKHKEFISKKKITMQSLLLKVEGHTETLKRNKEEYKLIQKSLEKFPSVQNHMNRQINHHLQHDDEVDTDGWSRAKSRRLS